MTAKWVKISRNVFICFGTRPKKMKKVIAKRNKKKKIVFVNILSVMIIADKKNEF
jgi:hypothetical protein